MRAKLAAAREYIDAALPVVRVVTDADILWSKSDDLPTEPVDPGRLDALAAELGLENSAERLWKAMARGR